ncbi:MAG: acyl-CoA thioesterase [Planctomycetes bacterium]|nr:acyl-CoA thioesterase [Planctomycetota bacterium]MCA8935566.1 acyl-CoA thioesterase [Planctomycetota bacterium]MCA8945264.1 acyl-CoA thioesterase [Planctomycetota bacterium]
MPYVSTYELEVRSYELDVYDHVNNAVYLNWLEHGRSKLLQDKGFNYLSIMDTWGVQFMTVRTEIDYRKALKLGDRAVIRTQVDRVGNTSVTIAHQIVVVGDPEPAAEAKVVIVFTDAKSGKPTPVPEHFTRLYA